MWWHKSYVNRRAWMLDEFEHLDINANELILLLVIDQANSQNQIIDMNYLQKKTKLDASSLDIVLHGLINKKIVSIVSDNNQIQFNIDGIFKLSNPYQDVKADLLNRFESEFGRPLTQQELLKLNELVTNYDENMIVYGLREAIVNQKLTLNYVDKVVRSKK